MSLLAISDLHVSAPGNLQAVADIRYRPQDTLIVAGDVCEDIELFELCMGLLARRFRKVIWTPGNHELWHWRGNGPRRAIDRYDAFVGICQRYNIGTPEEESITVELAESAVQVVPIFTLYDGGFANPLQSHETKLADDALIDPSPFGSIAELCHALIATAEQRLCRLSGTLPRVFVSHFPLTATCAREPGHDWLAAVSGSPRTEPWIEQFAPSAVVFGHQHRPRSRVRSGVRFEEVSLGYPRDWDSRIGIEPYLRDLSLA